MSIISTTRGNPQASDIAVETALPMVGSGAREDLQATLGFADAELSKLFEDRNILLTGGGTLTYTTGSPSQLSMTASLVLIINSQVAGGTPTSVDLGSSTRNFSADGRMLYAVVNRLAGTAVITADSATLPVVTSANQEVFLIAKRVTSGTERLFLRNGQSLANGDTAPLGGASTTVSSQLRVSSGTAEEPAIVFISDDDGYGTGIYRATTNSLAFAANGINVAQYSATGAWTLGPVAGVVAHAIQGTLSFNTTETTQAVNGFRQSATNTLAISTNSIDQLTISTSSISSALSIIIGTDTTTASRSLTIRSDDTATERPLVELQRGGTSRGIFGISGGTNDIITGTVVSDLALRANGNILISADNGTTTHGKVTNTGLWILGPSTGGNLNHVIQSGAQTALVIQATGSNVNAKIDINGTGSGVPHIEWKRDGASATASSFVRMENGCEGTLPATNIAGTDYFYWKALGTTLVGSVNTSGAWVLGPSSTTSLSHTVYGRINTNSTTYYGRLNQTLALNTAASFGGAAFAAWTSTATQRSVLDLNRSRGTTIGTHTIVASGDYLGSIIGQGSTGSGFESVAGIDFTVDTLGVVSPTSIPGRISFNTAPTGTVSPSEKGSVNNAGLWILGAASGTQTHVINGTSVDLNSVDNATQAYLHFKKGGTSTGKIGVVGSGGNDIITGSTGGDLAITTIPGSTNVLFSSGGSTIQGRLNSSGVWFLGANSTAHTNHQVYGNLQLGKGGGLHYGIYTEDSTYVGANVYHNGTIPLAASGGVSNRLSITYSGGFFFQNGATALANAEVTETTVGSCSPLGLWTLGPVGTNVVHAIHGRVLQTLTGAALFHDATTATLGSSQNFAMEIGDASRDGVLLGVRRITGGSVTDGFIALNRGGASPYNYMWTDSTDRLRISTNNDHIGTTNGAVVGDQAAPSDERLKENFEEVEYGLSEILALDPKRFNYKARPDKIELGLMAQAVREIIPEAVYDSHITIDGYEGSPDGQLILQYNTLMPVLINAIKELKSTNDELRARIDGYGIP